jgi:hypothetical protein
MEENTPDLKKVLQAGHLAKVSLYRQLLKKVANGASLCTSELRTIRDLGAELEALAKGEDQPRALDSGPAQNLTSMSRSDFARHVFRVSPQTISKWLSKQGMPRNDDGSYSPMGAGHLVLLSDFPSSPLNPLCGIGKATNLVELSTLALPSKTNYDLSHNHDPALKSHI